MATLFGLADGVTYLNIDAYSSYEVHTDIPMVRLHGSGSSYYITDDDAIAFITWVQKSSVNIPVQKRKWRNRDKQPDYAPLFPVLAIVNGDPGNSDPKHNH